MNTTTYTQQQRHGDYVRLLLTLLSAIICIFSAPIISAAAYQQEIHVEFSFDTSAIATKTVTGYRLYKETKLVCETGPVTPQIITCTDSGESGTYSFTLSALYNDGSESLQSAPFPFTIGDGATLAAVISTASQTGQAPFSLSFDGSRSTGSISSYSWSFGDGESATGITTTHTYQFQGSYTATLTVTDANGQTKQSSIAITATAPAPPPPPPPTPPVVVISSSSAVGDAPFTVQFDGSGSSSAQPPIVSYTWEFGDGASGQGAAVAHTFTTPGTYSTTLTVTDSIGLTGQASTPVIINLPPPKVNEPPSASFTATPTSGKAPLTVAFNGSGSSDPDGSISDYAWSFGDGSSATGVSAGHIFTDAGDFVVSLHVTDNQGATTVSSQTISVLPADEIDFELLEVQADSNWTKFTFSKPFINPVVVAGPPSYADAAPATIRIRNVTPTGFEARIQEWNYLDGKHAFEKFSFIVMEKGTYTLDNGAKLEAGTFTGTTAFQKISLQQPYAVAPVILTQVTTYNEADAVTGRIRNSSATSFEYRLQEQEKNRNSHTPETISYIAWEPGKGEYAGLIYETGFTTKSVTQNWFTLTYKTTFPTRPLFIAGMQTYADINPAAVRAQNLTQTATQIKIEEEKSKSTDISHTSEVIGYLSITAATP